MRRASAMLGKVPWACDTIKAGKAEGPISAFWTGRLRIQRIAIPVSAAVVMNRTML